MGEVPLYSPILTIANMCYEHDEVSGCFRFEVGPQWSLAVQRAVKRGIDVAIGLVGSTVTLLLTPVVFLLVNLEERGPLFYRSSYLGQDRNTRYYLKFRTMHVDADRILEMDPALRSRFHAQQKLLDDPRITKVGRFLRKYSLDHLKKLLSVKPGVTGFWQVMGRQTTTYPERVQMDMFYLDRWSIWLDLVIIIKTFWKVLKAEGAY